MNATATRHRDKIRSARKLPKIPLALQLVLALVIGTLTGLIFGPRTEFLGEIGIVIIKLLKALATPLVFFAVIDAFCKTHIPGKSGIKLIIITSLNAGVAVTLALILTHLFPVGSYVNLDSISQALGNLDPAAAKPELPALSLKNILNSLIPTSFGEAFAGNQILSVVLLALLAGLAIRSLKVVDSSRVKTGAAADTPSSTATVESFVAGALAIVLKILEWVIRILPLAVFTVVAKAVGTVGLDVFRALAVLVALVLVGLMFHVFIYYSSLLFFYARVSPLTFFKNGTEALLTALGIGSSLATLPVTLKTLDEKMHVSHASARLAACVGTNLNNDGIILYEAMAAMFVAQLHGIHLNIGQQISMALVSIVAAAGIAGIPEAGLITLSVVLTTVGLPLTALPFLLSVDWFLGRLRATTNVASDMTVATLLDV